MIKGTYTTGASDLAITIVKIHHIGKTYVKVWALLYNKYNHIIYETKNYKLIKKNISHWRLLNV